MPHAVVAQNTVTDCLSTLGIHVPIIDRVGRYPHRRSSSTAST